MSAEPLSDEDCKLLMLHVERQGQNISFGPSFQSDALRLLATITARDERIQQLAGKLSQAKLWVTPRFVSTPDAQKLARELRSEIDALLSGSPQTSKGHQNADG